MSKVKVLYIFSNSLDSLLSSSSRDVFTGSLAQSVPELQPIKLHLSLVAGLGVKGKSYYFVEQTAFKHTLAFLLMQICACWNERMREVIDYVFCALCMVCPGKAAR